MVRDADNTQGVGDPQDAPDKTQGASEVVPGAPGSAQGGPGEAPVVPERAPGADGATVGADGVLGAPGSEPGVPGSEPGADVPGGLGKVPGADVPLGSGELNHGAGEATSGADGATPGAGIPLGATDPHAPRLSSEQDAALPFGSALKDRVDAVREEAAGLGQKGRELLSGLWPAGGEAAAAAGGASEQYGFGAPEAGQGAGLAHEGQAVSGPGAQSDSVLPGEPAAPVGSSASFEPAAPASEQSGFAVADAQSGAEAVTPAEYQAPFEPGASEQPGFGRADGLAAAASPAGVEVAGAAAFEAEAEAPSEFAPTGEPQAFSAPEAAPVQGSELLSGGEPTPAPGVAGDEHAFQAPEDAASEQAFAGAEAAVPVDYPVPSGQVLPGEPAEQFGSVAPEAGSGASASAEVPSDFAPAGEPQAFSAPEAAPVQGSELLSGGEPSPAPGVAGDEPAFQAPEAGVPEQAFAGAEAVTAADYAAASEPFAQSDSILPGEPAEQFGSAAPSEPAPEQPGFGQADGVTAAGPFADAEAPSAAAPEAPSDFTPAAEPQGFPAPEADLEREGVDVVPSESAASAAEEAADGAAEQGGQATSDADAADPADAEAASEAGDQSQGPAAKEDDFGIPLYTPAAGEREPAWLFEALMGERSEASRAQAEAASAAEQSAADEASQEPDQLSAADADAEQAGQQPAEDALMPPTEDASVPPAADDAAGPGAEESAAAFAEDAADLSQPGYEAAPDNQDGAGDAVDPGYEQFASSNRAEPDYAQPEPSYEAGSGDAVEPTNAGEPDYRAETGNSVEPTYAGEPAYQAEADYAGDSAYAAAAGKQAEPAYQAEPDYQAEPGHSAYAAAADNQTGLDYTQPEPGYPNEPNFQAEPGYQAGPGSAVEAGEAVDSTATHPVADPDLPGYEPAATERFDSAESAAPAPESAAAYPQPGTLAAYAAQVPGADGAYREEPAGASDAAASQFGETAGDPSAAPFDAAKTGAASFDAAKTGASPVEAGKAGAAVGGSLAALALGKKALAGRSEQSASTEHFADAPTGPFADAPTGRSDHPTEALAALSGQPKSPADQAKTPADHPARASKDQPSEPPAGRKKRRLWPFFGLFLLLAALAYVAVAFFFTSNVPAQASVAGVDIGGMSREEAIKKLNDQLGPRVSNDMTVKVGKHTHQINPSDFSASFDAKATVDSVAGFSLSPGRVWQGISGGSEIAPVVKVDEAKLSNTVKALTDQTISAPVNASVTFKGTKAVTTPAARGETVDRKAALASLRTGAVSDKPVVIGVTRQAPEITDEKATKAVEDYAKPLVSGKLTVTVDSTPVEISPQQLASVARFSAEDGELVMKLDPAALGDLVRKGAPSVLKDGKDATIEIVNHQTPKITPSEDGVGVDEAKLSEDATKAVLSSDRTVQINSQPISPKFTTEDAQKMGVKEVVSQIETPLTDDAVRTTNLQVGTRKVTNTLVKPGERFSLLEKLGPIDASNGFVSSGVVANGFNSTAMGGGLSQLSTNMYNIGFLAGYKDIEHKPHSKYFDRYPMGREATLWEGQIDMVWENNTPYGAVIETWVADGKVHSRLWSTKYWKVETKTSAPYNKVAPTTKTNPSADCEPSGKGDPGFTVDIWRKVSRDGQVHEEKTTSWTYEPVNAVVCN